MSCNIETTVLDALSKQRTPWDKPIVDESIILDNRLFGLFNADISRRLKEEYQVDSDENVFNIQEVKAMDPRADYYGYRKPYTYYRWRLNFPLIDELEKKRLNPPAAEGVKPGVEELFESNPELANQVYEALGFGNFITDTLSNIERIKKYLPKTIELTTPQSFAEYGYSLKSDYSDEIGTILRSFAANNISDKEFSDRLLGIIEEQKNIGENDEEIRRTNIRFFELRQLAYTIKYRNLIFNNKDNIIKNILKKQNSNKFELLKFDDKGTSFVIKTDYGNSGIGFNSLNNKIWENSNESILIENNQITPQQKQQALQLYSQYLDSIFPDSKVAEIDNSLYISVLEDLKSNKIIEKKCS